MDSNIQPQSTNLRMYEEALPATCIQLADFVAQLDFHHNFRLVGGTALALLLGHRQSIDLDFFSDQEFDPVGWDIVFTGSGVKGKSIHAHNHFRFDSEITKVEFIYFAYPYHFPQLQWRGLNMLSGVDIGLLKLLAIIGRNRRKDIIDLYFIHREIIPLSELVGIFFTRFEKADVNLIQQISMLFDEAELLKDPMPIMLKPFDWVEGYTTVKAEITQAIRQQMGLSM